jgi:hypothetical protein
MDKQPEMLDFVKAMSDADRLRIIGVLTQRSARAAEVASELNIPPRDAFNHLEFLQFVGVVRKEEDVYHLDSSGLEALSKKQFAGDREAYTPAPDLDKESRKVLVAYLNSDGTIKQIPSQPARLKVLLRYLVQAFTPGQNYTEKEVNTILRRFHIDVSGLRRDLIDSGLMARESNGSRYWRVT